MSETQAKLQERELLSVQGNILSNTNREVLIDLSFSVVLNKQARNQPLNTFTCDMYMLHVQQLFPSSIIKLVFSAPPSSSSLALLNIKHAVVCFMLLATHYGLMFKRLLTGFSRSSISS